MKHITKFIFFSFIVGFMSCQKPSLQVVAEFVSNNMIKKIRADSLHASSITTCIYAVNENGKNIICDELPLFEFVINKTTISASNPIWIFNGVTQRVMLNGGTEYILRFTAVKGVAEGLQVTLYQQVFPNSALIREKLMLSATDDKRFSLHKKNGQLYFRFPQYGLRCTSSDSVSVTEINLASWEKNSTTFGAEPKGNHMFYPSINSFLVKSTADTLKGPISILSNGKYSWFTAYEHASQDNINGLFDVQKKGSGSLINDAMQGTKGVFNFPVTDKDFKFLGLENKRTNGNCSVAVVMLRGGYVDGEIIDKLHPYETVWIASAFYEGNSLSDGKRLLNNYLLNQICENMASRKPEYYYNTWGLQREDPEKPLRGILTYDRIFEEIEYASELGVDIFVLDDGWEEAQGDWTPNKERLPQGLAPIKKRLDELGMKMGLWFSPMGIDSTTSRYKEHPQWVIKDSEGNPIAAQWGHPAFDFVSDFFYLFVDDCKKLIDEGCRFMKWDAINTFYSSLPNLHHGDSTISEAERRARYDYLLPIYVTRAMKMLTDYEPELVIEIDLTEARRIMTGLAPLSQGKLFWMNNGASTYNDYTTFRTKSMRTIANEYAGIIPLELLTYANYPQNLSGNMAYNVDNSLLAGHGFWGNLKLTSKEERDYIKEKIFKSKRVLDDIIEVEPEVFGKVGDSPEIYIQLNREIGSGQIIAFSEGAFNYNLKTPLITNKVLAVLDEPYRLARNVLTMDLIFNEKPSSLSVFVIPNNGRNVTIVSSTSPIVDVNLSGSKLEYRISKPGKQLIRFKNISGKPAVCINKGVDCAIRFIDDEAEYEMEINVNNVCNPVIISL